MQSCSDETYLVLVWARLIRGCGTVVRCGQGGVLRKSNQSEKKMSKLTVEVANARFVLRKSKRRRDG